MREEKWPLARRLAGISGIVYVALAVTAAFVAGLGNQFHGTYSPAEVVTWATQHESAVRWGVLTDVLGQFVLVAFVVLLAALSDGRSLAAVLAYLGVGVSTAVFIVVWGLQYSVPLLARLPEPNTAAQAAVVLQAAIEGFRLLPIALTIGAVGYLTLRSGTLPATLAVALIVISVLTAMALPAGWLWAPLQDLDPLTLFGLFLWILVASVVLLLRPVRVQHQAAAQAQLGA